MSNGPPLSPNPKKRQDGRRQMLVYITPEIIKEVKKIAVDDETTASAIAEQAMKEWLAKRGLQKS